MTWSDGANGRECMLKWWERSHREGGRESMESERRAQLVRMREEENMHAYMVINLSI